MATIFPSGATPGQIFEGYVYNGTAWEIQGEDWKPNTYAPEAPAYAESGFIWIDSDENIDEVDLSQYLTATSFSTLSNKTINGSNNTFSNIPQSAVTNLVSDLSSKQGVVSGVSDTEIGYLNGVTSSIQDQLDSKLDSSSASSTYLTQSAAAATYAPLSNLAFAGASFTGTTRIQEVAEHLTISATASTGTINYDVLTNHAITYYTVNASGNFTLNFRGNGSTTLNSLMSVGESLTLTFLCTNGVTPYYNNAIQIDGASVTPKWQGGTAPTSGNASSIDAYTYTILKTASATYTVLASQTRFA